jgi:2-keto-4-pentenoate hydratase/2-oxohepta-3-ene-1,7-dioic acid hydratase in catechol pathway
MRLLSFQTADGPSWGALTAQDRVLDLGRGRPEPGWPDLISALRDGIDAIREAASGENPTHPLDGLELLPVIPAPGKILCVGLNFEKHRIETGRERTPRPVIFTRFADSIVGHGSPLLRPSESSHFDYEGELAVVIGRQGRRINERHALAHVAGVTCFNDGSIRDFQAHTQQFTPGKNFPSTGAMGPWLATLDETGDPGALDLVTRLNGVVMQHAPLSDLTYSIAEIIAYCSMWTALQPGDVIATGTPGGIGARRTPPVWMGPGDVCEVEISGIGTLRNRVVAEAAPDGG